ncbi:MtrB/PioB family decaheme-associated outer membrane protein [Shewanella sp. GXUN23E]|uniref:MtrB/PioB family decaheme-associated outer membrane protein n=1 Tax=Shewanella sp. GXUN23E TaxID=3422498 RepID=UPI003D7ED740
MKFPLNLITLALLGASGSVMALDFSVTNANTSAVNVEDYQCRQCVIQPRHQGEISVSAGYVDGSDPHAGNRFGTDEDGLNGSVSGDIRYHNDEGYRSAIQAHQLGLENSFAHIESGKVGRYQVDLDYRMITSYRNGDVPTQLWHDNGVLSPSETTRLLDLNLERQKAGLGLEYRLGDLQSWIRYDREEKTGHRQASLVSPKPINFALPVDSSTDSLAAGLAFSGQHWLVDLNYQGSLYDNDIEHLSLTVPLWYDIYSATPDNQAHQLSLSGQYQLNTTVMTGRVVAGRMIQDDDLIPVSGNPIVNWDGEVDTLDAGFNITSMLTNRLRLGASVDYSDRDNKSSLWDFNQGIASLSFDPLSGGFSQNLPLDIERQTYKLNAAYRLASGYRLMAGYDRKEVSRSYGEREDTHDDKLWAKLKISAIPGVVLQLDADYGKRGGSEYQANELTSTEETSLLRKYHLADRERTAVALKVNWQAMDWLSLDLRSYYAVDDYDESVLGLTHSKDYGYDLNANLTLGEQLTAYGFAGQQYIDSDIAGGEFAGAGLWQQTVEDHFINLGAGIGYTGLLDGRLSLGADYLFANSGSDAHLLVGAPTNPGDYYSYQHSASAYAAYALNAQMTLKLAYQYERYYDTDPGVVAVNAIPGLITLGDLNHNYNAHQIMLSFSYLLP